MPELHAISRGHSAPILTVVFVHGTDGHYIKTWGPTAPGENWIYWMGADHPRVDVFSVQHEGSIWSLTDYSTIAEYAGAIGYAVSKVVRTERLLFIGHSLGGIVVKQLVLMAESDPNLSSLAGRYLDFCFIATPHLGGNFGLARPLTTLVPNKLLGLVFGWNKEIQKINDRFLEVKNVKMGALISFAERRRLLGLKIIPDHAAFINDKRAQNLALSKDHRSICKLKSRDDVIYIAVDEFCKASPRRNLVGESEFKLDQQMISRAF
jgi:hypothetical protein